MTGALSPGRPKTTGVLSSEWLKLRSVRSTHHALGAAAAIVLLGAVWTYYVGTVWDGRDPAARAAFRAAAPEDGFLPFLQMVLGVLGVLAITSEYATGMVRTSLVAVPDRRRLFLAKTGVLTVLTLVVGHAVLLATYAVSRIIAGERTMGFNAGPFTADLPLLLAAGLSVTVLALFGLGMGTVTRSTAGGVASVAVLLFVLPGVAGVLPEPWNTRVFALFPIALVRQIAGDPVATQAGAGALPPLVALAVLAGYAVVAVAAGMVSFTRRDA
ncbi:ABC transporter permease [Planobispora rosea]|uniref:ABC transporter permease n=1 Tax=Planobispora rosea TaxID=35762 RepID=A0A8J3RVE7_PLARO|nr:ABC transporter permease [Planobispora rosea]GGS68018.1 ABC transporter permease [Planobispora rosea]GIH81944.1 ABC transporter permease [Planobispora rosea]